MIAFLAVGALLGGIAWAAKPWFASTSKPSSGKSGKPSWLAPSTSATKSIASSSSSLPAFDPCSAIKPEEACVLGGRVHRGPFDCPSAGAQVDHVTACPASEEPVATFALDRTEATLGRWIECVNAGKCAPLDLNDVPETPARGVPFAEAQAFCTWSGKRLPKDVEWELAAAGAGDTHRLYPWGNVVPDEAHAVYSVEGAPRAGPLAVGSIAQGATPEGLLDLAGNVAEWTSTSAPTSAPLPVSMQPDADASSARRWVRGGSFASSWDALRTWSREAVPESWSGRDVGVRCARDLPKSIKK